MQRKDNNLKIHYKFEDKILSLKFKTVQDFLHTNFRKNKNPMSPKNDTELISVTLNNKPLFKKCYKLHEVKVLLKDFNQSGLIRKEIYSIEEVKDKVKNVLFEEDNKLAKVDFDGDLIKGNSQRYQTFFTKGCKCVVCGIEGKYFAKERHLQDKSYHLNLYAVDDNGDEILMTKDHIIPRSKGGIDDISNYQTMCKICNEAKGNKLIGNNVVPIRTELIEVYGNCKIMFVRYVNADCETIIFKDFHEAIRYVYENFGLSKHRMYSKNCQRKIYLHIQNAINTKRKYCEGEWILINKQ